jgi:hypothetical protein
MENKMKQPIFEEGRCKCDNLLVTSFGINCSYCDEYEDKLILYNAKLENLASEFLKENTTEHLHLLLVNFYLKIKNLNQ